MNGKTFRVWATEHDNDTHEVVKVLSRKNYKYKASAIKAVRAILRDAYESGDRTVLVMYGETDVTFGVTNGTYWCDDRQFSNALLKHMI